MFSFDCEPKAGILDIEIVAGKSLKYTGMVRKQKTSGR